jgi:hypothetical protein
MNDAMISEVVQRTMANAGVALGLDYCSTETRMRLALGVEGAMDALYFLAVGEELSMSIESIRRGAAIAARLYGRQCADALVSA